jgi:hypothetical protein
MSGVYVMTTEEVVNLIADLAKEVDLEDPIDFGMLLVDEDTLWKMMASNVLELMRVDTVSERMVMMATITKLLVENFVLHAQMMKIMENNK